MRRILSVALVVATVAGCSSSRSREQHRAWLAEEGRREAQALDGAYAERTAGMRRVEAQLKRKRQMGRDPQAWATYAEELAREGDEVGAAAAREWAWYLASIADCRAVGDLRYDPQVRSRMTEACAQYYNSLSAMGVGGGLADLEARVEALEAQVD
jgi:hypothetical protein